MSILILDYGLGNIKSITSALKQFEDNIVLGSGKSELYSADALILPGVGAFQQAMGEMKKNGLDQMVREFAETKKPILGICLGMQMLFSYSEEFGYCEGLDLIQGSVKKLDPKNTPKLPNISWSKINPNKKFKNDSLLKGIHEKNLFYHIHSFYATPDNEDHLLASTKYFDKSYCSVAKKGNIYGCQFHPEKSGVAGLKIISNFLEISKNTNE